MAFYIFTTPSKVCVNEGTPRSRHYSARIRASLNVVCLQLQSDICYLFVFTVLQNAFYYYLRTLASNGTNTVSTGSLFPGDIRNYVFTHLNNLFRRVKDPYMNLFVHCMGDMPGQGNDAW